MAYERSLVCHTPPRFPRRVPPGAGSPAGLWTCASARTVEGPSRVERPGRRGGGGAVRQGGRGDHPRHGSRAEEPWPSASARAEGVVGHDPPARHEPCVDLPSPAAAPRLAPDAGAAACHGNTGVCLARRPPAVLPSRCPPRAWPCGCSPGGHAARWGKGWLRCLKKLTIPYRPRTGAPACRPA
jgi:hypothetical protein